MATANPRLRYRPEIDGVRAIAVVSVILFHAGVPGFANGFVGVDVFFVISGFLITSLMLSDLQSGSFSLLRFYERRVRRIMPALLLVLAVSTVAAWLILLPRDLLLFSRGLVAACLFGANFHFAKHTGYFDPAAEVQPLLHTWSLSVEEQYYLFFPLLLPLVWGRAREKCFWVVAAVALISLVSAEPWNPHRPEKLFFMFYARAWELAAGAMAAFLCSHHEPTPRSMPRGLLAALGLFLVLAATAVPTRVLYGPGVAVITATLGTFLILRHAGPDSLVTKALSQKALVSVGLVSYSAYLWHQPLLAYSRYVFGENPGVSVIAPALCILAALAFLSWRYVELPFRLRDGIPAKQIFGLAAAGTALLILLGMAGTNGPMRFWRLDEGQLALMQTASKSPMRAECHTSGKSYLRPTEACSIPANAQGSWAVMGNSHGVELAYALGQKLAERGEATRQFTFSSCEPTAGEEVSEVPGCNEWTRETIAYIQNSPKIRNVVLSYKMFVVAVKGRGDRTRHSAEDARGVAAWMRYVRTARILQSAGKDVFLVLQAPMLQGHVDHFISTAHPPYGFVAGISLETWRQSAIAQTRWRRDVPSEVHVIDPADAFCRDGICAAIMDGAALYFDAHHMSISGADILAARLIAAAGEPLQGQRPQ